MPFGSMPHTLPNFPTVAGLVWTPLPCQQDPLGNGVALMGATETPITAGVFPAMMGAFRSGQTIPDQINNRVP